MDKPDHPLLELVSQENKLRIDKETIVRSIKQANKVFTHHKGKLELLQKLFALKKEIDRLRNKIAVLDSAVQAGSEAVSKKKWRDMNDKLSRKDRSLVELKKRFRFEMAKERARKKKIKMKRDIAEGKLPQVYRDKVKEKQNAKKKTQALKKLTRKKGEKEEEEMEVIGDEEDDPDDGLMEDERDAPWNKFFDEAIDDEQWEMKLQEQQERISDAELILRAFSQRYQFIHHELEGTAEQINTDIKRLYRKVAMVLLPTYLLPQQDLIKSLSYSYPNSSIIRIDVLVLGRRKCFNL